MGGKAWMLCQCQESLGGRNIGTMGGRNIGAMHLAGTRNPHNRFNVAIPFMDHLLEEMSSRFSEDKRAGPKFFPWFHLPWWSMTVFYAHDQKTQQQESCETADRRGSKSLISKDRNAHIRASCFIRSRMTSWPHRLKKTSSMQSKRRDLHHTWLHRETNQKLSFYCYSPRWITTTFSKKSPTVLSEPKFGPPQSKIPGSAPVWVDE